MRYVVIFLLIIFVDLHILYSDDLEDSFFKFTPYVTSYNEFNSNFLSLADNNISVIMLKVLPGFILENKNKTDNTVKFNLNTSYKYFLALDDRYSNIASENSDFDLKGELNLVFFKKGNFTIYTRDDFSKESYSGHSAPIRKFINNFNFGIQTTPFGKALKFLL